MAKSGRASPYEVFLSGDDGDVTAVTLLDTSFPALSVDKRIPIAIRQYIQSSFVEGREGPQPELDITNQIFLDTIIDRNKREAHRKAAQVWS